METHAARPEKNTDHGPTCWLDDALTIVGGRWKSFVLWEIIGGPLRYGEIRRRVPGVSERSLIRLLRELEVGGVVHREQYPEVPPRVEYSLTPHGEALIPILKDLARWAELRD